MAIDVRHPNDLDIAPAGARPLGVRVKPILRLAMGHKNERGYPVKDDHFSPRGDDRAVAKFLAEYGDAAKAVEILLPSELDVALSIQYRAFKGGGDGEGGTLVAIGQTNYAHRDYCGGRDLVTVFNKDGSVDEIETGLDANTREPLDATARELGLELYTTLTAMMPGVLGFGSYFALTTKGKESTDNLWLKLRQLYELFGSKITFAVKPQLVIRSSTARPVIEKDGEKKRISTTIYVADIVVPETIDEMIERLQSRQAALGDPATALYGRELTTGSNGANESTGGKPAAGGGGDASASPKPAAPTAGDDDDDDDDVEVAEWVPVEGPSDEEVALAAAIVVPSGVHKDKTLADVAGSAENAAWFLTQLKRLPVDAPARPSIETFVQGRLPETWARYETWKGEQS